MNTYVCVSYDAGTSSRIHFSRFLHTQTFPLSLSLSPPHPCAHTHHVPNLAPGPMLRALLSWSAVINPTAAIRHCSISLQTQRCLITRICRLINADTTCETELLRSTLQLFEYLTLSDLPPALGGYTAAAFPESEPDREAE